MKKLLFILSAILVSGMTYGANSWKHSNPFAYDLSYELRNNGNTLALIYSLNANAVTSNTHNDTLGVKINLIDEQQNSYTIRHITSSSSTCVQRGRRTVEISISEIPAAFKDKPITWEIEVFGNKKRTSPLIIGSAAKNPINAHGIGINTDPTHQNFGQIFVSEAYPSTTDGRNSLLEFDPQLQYVKRHVKQIHIVSSTETSTTSYFSGDINYEPHRVKTTTDGRVFVTCYHPTAGGAVLEYLGNNTFKNVIAFDKTVNKGSDSDKTKELYRRVIGMDVKGEGADLKIVVAWIDANGYKYPNSKTGAKIELYEYEIGKAEAASVVMPLPQVIGTTTTSVYVKKIGEEVDYRSGTDLDGLLHQGFNGLWNSCLRGFVDVAYGKNNDVWMKIDHGARNDLPGRIILFRGGKNIPDVLEANTQDKNSSYDDYFGGNAIIYDDYYYGSSNKGSSSIISGFSFGKIKGHKIEIADDATTKPSKMFTGQWDVSNTTNNHAERIGYWVTAFARDYAGNLYALTERRDDYAGSTASDHSFNANILCIAMPYSGSRVTRANTTLTISDPVPNINATDLCCTPHETQPKYIFSFNVNTKPEGAEIRLYTSEQDMLSDSEQNAAYSDYDNHDNCAYYYRFSSTELKQGRMSVELDILGHEGGKELTDKKLPSGKLYWNVFLKTRQSNVFAPIYKQPILDENGMRTHYRLYATIDNNPNNEGFGHIYAIDYQQIYTNDDKTKYDGMDKNPCKLMIFTIGDENIDDKIFGNIASDSRYTLLDCLTTNEMVQPRRPTVAPDGMVYLTDYGDYDTDNHSFENGPKSFVHGGIWLFDPKDPFKNGSDTEAKLSRFYDAYETVSDVCFYNDGTSLKLYKTNTYGEFSHHGTVANDPNNYQAEKWMNNGYRIYTMEYNQDGSLKHKMSLEDGPVTPFKVRDSNNKLVGGDANGVFSVRATKDGVWFCQNRKGNFTVSPSNKPDNRENVALMFYNQSGERKFESYTYNGGSLSQSTTAVLQSTPGAGMTISPDEKYLYVVNHEGNILEFEIGGDANTGKTLTLKNTFINSTDYKCISSMNFDYAGNLVVTTDESYPANASEKTQIVVFTLPYNRDNARSIPASKAQREIPERLSQDLDNSTTLAKEGTYDVELYRPLQGATFNTICLPFEVDLTTLPAAHKLYGATVMDFTSVSTPSVGNETVLSLNFTKVDKMLAGKPYIIYVEDHVRGLIEFSQVTRKNTVVPQSVVWNVQNSSITYTGVFNPIEIEEGKTILVDQNRLANVTNKGTLSGFRGYFTIPESFSSLKSMISTKRDTPTGLEDLNITERTYQKFLREGRVYIRMGDSLYTVDGQKVE